MITAPPSRESQTDAALCPLYRLTNLSSRPELYRLRYLLGFAMPSEPPAASSRKPFGSGLSVYTITITINSAELKKYKTHKEIIEALSSLEYIYHIEEMR